MNAPAMFKPMLTTDSMTPWVRRACESYAKRLRVLNFTQRGNALFHDMVRDAVDGKPVYFIMVPNGQAETKTGDSTDITVANTVQDTDKTDMDGTETDNATDTTVDATGTVQNTDNTASSAVTKVESHTVKSDHDPFPVSTILNDEELEEKCGSVANISIDGECYDDEGNIIEGLWCLSLTNPPISEYAVSLSQRIQDISRFVNKSLPDLLVPQRYAVNTDPATVYAQRTDSQKADNVPSAELEAKEARKTIHIDQDPSNSHTVSTGQYAQWDNSRISELERITACEFLGETNVPPTDFPELGTLGLTTESLVSNRESFVSSANALKVQIGSVFEKAGVPVLDWDTMFPYTPQDIASIGDAVGKQLSPEVLSYYTF